MAAPFFAAAAIASAIRSIGASSVITGGGGPSLAAAFKNLQQGSVGAASMGASFALATKGLDAFTKGLGEGGSRLQAFNAQIAGAAMRSIASEIRRDISEGRQIAGSEVYSMGAGDRMKDAASSLNVIWENLYNRAAGTMKEFAASFLESWKDELKELAKASQLQQSTNTPRDWGVEFAEALTRRAEAKEDHHRKPLGKL